MKTALLLLQVLLGTQVMNMPKTGTLELSKQYDTADLSIEFVPSVGLGFDPIITVTGHRRDVDTAIIEVFYKTKRVIDGKNIELLLHETVNCPLVYGTTVLADQVKIDIKDVAFVRVRELKQLNEVEFGR